MEANAMNNELQIHIPQHQPELEFSILEFIQEEFQQNAIFQDEPASAIPHKDGGVLGTLWQVVQIIGVIEGALQFSERARRLERVKKLQAAIQRAGKPVYLRIKNHTVNLYQKSADQIMNLLAGDKDDG
jgi:hypothetical protein